MAVLITNNGGHGEWVSLDEDGIDVELIMRDAMMDDSVNSVVAIYGDCAMLLTVEGGLVKRSICEKEIMEWIKTLASGS